MRWGSHKSADSLYGSALTISPAGEVSLVNHLMPGGTTIQEWYSVTDYQSVRDTPDLPLLHAGRTYRVAAQVTSVPEGTLVFEARFFDRFDALVGVQVLHAPDCEFEYPGDAHHYAIRMVNAGCDELHFTSLALLEVDGNG
ncbi:accessory Sec system protein Asp3 [Gryllotalpicola daejeonensis]|uniref:accessory Sec system protein Asp3 n=1 Tax=Gryllotalpicola daejeonensis TaxID=993087 RepID=UPI0031D4FC87